MNDLSLKGVSKRFGGLDAVCNIDMDVAHGEENTHYNTKAYVKNILMGSLALVFDVEYIYNTTVADDQSNDEIYSTMSLSYDF